jgi:hypothetical protein
MERNCTTGTSDAASAENHRVLRRDEWTKSLEAEYEQQRRELGVQRLSYEQRDAVRRAFWETVWNHLSTAS